MKLSIITINYNNVEGLRKTLTSVAAQTYSDIEHIIVDGGSADGSVDVIREYEQENANHQHPISISWVSEKDNGIYHAMNKGICKATGDYVWILNSGDCVADEDTIALMMAVLEKNSFSMLLGNIVRSYPDGRMEREKKIRNGGVPTPLETSMLTFYRGTVPQDAAFVRRDLFERYGLFDDSLKIVSDWKLYLNMIALGDVVPMYVDIDVVLFDMDGISNTNHERRLSERRAYLTQVLHPSILKDYDRYATPISQYERIHKYHLWGLVWFLERVLFKLEKWDVLKK